MNSLLFKTEKLTFLVTRLLIRKERSYYLGSSDGSFLLKFIFACVQYMQKYMGWGEGRSTKEVKQELKMGNNMHLLTKEYYKMCKIK